MRISPLDAAAWFLAGFGAGALTAFVYVAALELAQWKERKLWQIPS